MQHNKLVVFDIETVPEPTYSGGKDFPPPAFHQVVAIAFLEADIVRLGTQEKYELKDLRAGGELNYSEKDLLHAFAQYIDRLTPRVVTYNGRGFDIPVLKYRGMAHSLSLPTFYQPEYSYRYNMESNCDLLEVLTDFGASTRMRLTDVCTVMKIPSKLGMDGADVAQYYRTGKLNLVRNYCETDVISTYLVYLRSMLHKGTLSTDGFESAVNDLKQYLTQNQNNRPHLGEYLKEWEKF